MTGVTIPNSVASIGERAFGSCPNLTSATIGTGVASIEFGAFSDCGSLTGITVDEFNSVYGSVAGVLFNKSLTTLIQCPGAKAGSYTVPESVTSVGDHAFGYCTSLSSVTISSSVTSIAGNLFEYCSSLASVTIPASVTSIGNYAFRYCTSLTSIIIPDSLTRIAYQPRVPTARGLFPSEQALM